MGRNIRFWIAPGLKNDNVLTPSTLTIHADGRVAVIEVRPPLKGEQGWQCWPDTPLEAQIRELLADWGGDAPGWTAPHAEENGNAADCFYITVLAAFDLPPSPVTPRHSINPIRMHTQAELMKVQGFKPGAEAKAANRASVGPTIERPPGGQLNWWLDQIMPSIDRLDEIGGADDSDYCDAHAYIAAECLRRLSVLQPNRAAIVGTERRYATFSEGVAVELAKPDLDAARRACSPKGRKSFVTIELEINGGHVAAERAVEAVLDAGTLQDAINEYDGDAPVKVKAATIVRGAS